MPGKQSTTVGVANPWYPEGGPGRHLKARLASGEVMMGAMLFERASALGHQKCQHAGCDLVCLVLTRLFWTRSPGRHNRELPRFVEEIG